MYFRVLQDHLLLLFILRSRVWRIRTLHRHNILWLWPSCKQKSFLVDKYCRQIPPAFSFLPSRGAFTAQIAIERTALPFLAIRSDNTADRLGDDQQSIADAAIDTSRKRRDARRRCHPDTSRTSMQSRTTLSSRTAVRQSHEKRRHREV